MSPELANIVRLHDRILDNLNTCVMVVDPDLHVVYVNPSSEMLLATSSRKACGMQWTSLVLAPDDFMSQLRETLDTGHPFTKREQQLDIAGNRTVTVDCTVTPLYVSQRPEGLLIELIPVDRHIRISREENLIAQNQVTRALVRGMAHEIKNPLGGLRGAAQLLQGELASEELKEYTRIIIDEADRLQNLVDRMLGPNSLPHKTEINIHQILERVRQLVVVEAPDGIEIRRDYDPSIPTFDADADQLIQATLNIVRNALQALGQEGVITLRTRAQRQFTIGQTRYKLVVMVEVIDNGPGIPGDMLENIFLPMVTGRAQGTGLGLSIAQSLVNRHHGLIECSSKPGRTVFRILLPLESANE